MVDGHGMLTVRAGVFLLRILPFQAPSLPAFLSSSKYTRKYGVCQAVSAEEEKRAQRHHRRLQHARAGEHPDRQQLARDRAHLHLDADARPTQQRRGEDGSGDADRPAHRLMPPENSRMPLTSAAGRPDSPASSLSSVPTQAKAVIIAQMRIIASALSDTAATRVFGAPPPSASGFASSARSSAVKKTSRSTSIFSSDDRTISSENFQPAPLPGKARSRRSRVRTRGWGCWHTRRYTTRAWPTRRPCRTARGRVPRRWEPQRKPSSSRTATPTAWRTSPAAAEPRISLASHDINEQRRRDHRHAEADAGERTRLGRASVDVQQHKEPQRAAARTFFSVFPVFSIVNPLPVKLWGDVPRRRPNPHPYHICGRAAIV